MERIVKGALRREPSDLRNCIFPLALTSEPPAYTTRAVAALFVSDVWTEWVAQVNPLERSGR